jgi:hypothetical protein
MVRLHLTPGQTVPFPREVALVMAAMAGITSLSLSLSLSLSVGRNLHQFISIDELVPLWQHLASEESATNLSNTTICFNYQGSRKTWRRFFIDT